jgi:hypothetical protein
MPIHSARRLKYALRLLKHHVFGPLSGLTESPLLAQSGHKLVHCTCPLLGGEADMTLWGNPSLHDGLSAGLHRLSEHLFFSSSDFARQRVRSCHEADIAMFKINLSKITRRFEN